MYCASNTYTNFRTYAAIFCAVNCALLNSCYVPLVNRIDQKERGCD